MASRTWQTRVACRPPHTKHETFVIPAILGGSVGAGITETQPSAIHPPRIPWRKAEVLEVFPETPRVKSLLLRVPGWPGHAPGQHVDVRLTAEDGYRAEGSYSLASAPAPDLPEREILQLTVERLGDEEVSPYLAEQLRAGDRLELRGPIGGYFTWMVNSGGPLILVAGGTGIVPIMSMLRHRAAQRSRIPAWLLNSSRDFEEIVYRQELERLEAAGDGLRVVHTLTRSQPPEWQGYRRRIDREMLRAVMPPLTRARAYVCGPEEMVEAVAAALVKLGYDPERVKNRAIRADRRLSVAAASWTKRPVCWFARIPRQGTASRGPSPAISNQRPLRF